MRNFGKILLVGGKSSWEKNAYICSSLIYVVTLIFIRGQGKKLHIPQLRMWDHNERELQKELFEDQSYSI